MNLKTGINKKIENSILKFLILFCIFFPLAIILILSFTKNWAWPEILPKNWGLRSWKHFFNSGTNSFLALFNSIFISFLVTLITFALTIPAARVLAFYTFNGKNLIELFFLSPLVIPSVVIAMGLHIEFIKLNLANSYLGVILINIFPCIPYSIRIFKAGFLLIDKNIEYQALVLGASKLKTFFQITIPIIMPSVIVSGVMVFIISFSQYFLTFFIGGGQILTFPMLMVPFIQSGDRMVASTFSIVFIAMIIILLNIMEWIVKKIWKQNGKLDN